MIVWTLYTCVLPIDNPDAKFWLDTSMAVADLCYRNLFMCALWRLKIIKPCACALTHKCARCALRVCHLRCSQLNLKIQAITFKISLTTSRQPLNGCFTWFLPISLNYLGFDLHDWLFSVLIIMIIRNIIIISGRFPEINPTYFT